MLLKKITDSVSWFFRITLAKIRTFSAPMSKFRTFQVLKNEKSNFMTFQYFSGPVGTLLRVSLLDIVFLAPHNMMRMIPNSMIAIVICTICHVLFFRVSTVNESLMTYVEECDLLIIKSRDESTRVSTLSANA